MNMNAWLSTETLVIQRQFSSNGDEVYGAVVKRLNSFGIISVAVQLILVN